MESKITILYGVEVTGRKIKDVETFAGFLNLDYENEGEAGDREFVGEVLFFDDESIEFDLEAAGNVVDDYLIDFCSIVGLPSLDPKYYAILSTF